MGESVCELGKWDRLRLFLVRKSFAECDGTIFTELSVVGGIDVMPQLEISRWRYARKVMSEGPSVYGLDTSSYTTIMMQYLLLNLQYPER
jgi:hypothetical protein